MVRTERGITLVALIITIIVLVILAAVAITTVYESGLITFATEGVANYANAGQNENKMFNNTMNFINSQLKSIYSILDSTPRVGD